MSFTTINPSTGSVISSYSYESDQKIKNKVNNSFKRFETWSTTSHDEKRTHLMSLIGQIQSNLESAARLASIEMGKPIAEAQAELNKCISLCEYYVENFESEIQGRSITIENQTAHISHQPLGTILGIMPWNFPFWQVIRFAVPTIMAGNTVLLKHAENVSGSSLEIEKWFKNSGFPSAVFQSVIASHESIETMIKHPRLRGVSMTGSTAAGKKIASIAGAQMKPCLFELGGSDAYLVLADADVELAAKKLAQSRLLNSGQSCIAAKRFIVHSSVYEDFLQHLQPHFENAIVGDPQDKLSTIGPLARTDLVQKLTSQVSTSLAKGAKCYFQHSFKSPKGAFYPPTILVDIPADCPAFTEELFGPVAAVFKFDELSEALSIANFTNFGLGGGIFSKDTSSAQSIGEKYLKTGNVAINDYVKSHPKVPFGGIYDSGYGREMAIEGLLAFCNAKVTTINS